jgi:hypothetical protein
MTEPQVVALPQLVTVPDVEIVAAGTWKLASGEATFTAEDLAAAVQASACPAIGSPVLKLGHVDPRFDGEPAVGRVTNLRLTSSGAKISGDLAGVPAWLAAALPSAYPQRSIEGMYGYTCQIGHTHPFVITHLALLGVTAPGVGVLSSLKDVAALYGVAAAAGDQGSAWTFRFGGVMADAAPSPATTVEDIRRAYYDDPATPPTMWITEIQLSPLQLIVADESQGTLSRLPVKIGSDGTVTFGAPVQVQVSYVDAADQTTAASAGTPSGRALAVAAKLRGQADDHMAQLAAMRVTASWDADAQIGNLGDDPTQTQLDELFALPGDTRSDSKLPHHQVSSGGDVGEANLDGCDAGIAALNGARGGVSGVSDTARKAAYDHLAAHMTAGGKTPPDLKTSASGGLPDPATPAADQQNPAGEGPANSGPVHGQFVGTHTHPHSAYGAASQADDHADEGHPHTHADDNNHDHHNAATAGATVSASAGDGSTEDADMQFSDAQLATMRTKLGLAGDAELTPDLILAALQPAAGVQASGQPAPAAAAPAADPAPAAQPATASPVPVQAAALPPGMALVDQAALDELKRNANLGAEARAEQRRAYRDQVITAAIGDGKTPPVRREHWEKAWEVDAEGTEQVLASLAPGLIPLADIGTPGGEQVTGGGTTEMREYSALFGPPKKDQ